MDDDELARIQIRLTVLEALVAFQFAAQHMQSSDPAAAIARLRALLLERGFPAPDLDPARAEAARSELIAAVDRILALQDQLPRRLVD